MREIKFRAWDKQYKRYYQGPKVLDCISANGDGRVFFIDNPIKNFIKIEIGPPEDFVIEQYTGLKDKNGVEIYEGDIVQTNTTYYGDWLCRIEFQHGAFGYSPFMCKQVKNKDGWFEELQKHNPGSNHDQVSTDGFCIHYYEALDKGANTFSRFNIDDCGVIGNIHENKELIK